MSSHAATLAPLPAERDLAVGLVVAVLLHAALAVWSLHAVRVPRPLPPSPRDLVHTVRETVELPKPPPPEPPQAEPPKPPLPEPAPPVAAPRPRPVTPTRALQPAAKAPPVADNAPQPFALSQTYGDGGAGVAVQTAPDDVFGDPDVAADETNVRRRPIEVPTAPPPPPVEAEARKVEIVSALPRPACRHVQWPEGAETGNRVVEVVLGLDIGPDGAVRKVRILRGGGEPFDDAAVEHVKSCGWEPGRRDGQAFTDHVSFVVEFRPSGG